jgi:hypothetical protein
VNDEGVLFMPKGIRKDITGIRYGKLVVLGFSHVVYKYERTILYWTCKCDCSEVTTQKVDTMYQCEDGDRHVTLMFIFCKQCGKMQSIY